VADVVSVPAWVLIAALSMASAEADDGKVEVIFRQKTGLAREWKDRGWAPGRRFDAGAPASIDMSGYGGWMVARPDLPGTWGTLTFKMKAPAAYGNFLEVRVDSRREEMFPRIRLKQEHQTALADGWVQVRIPLRELNPGAAPFEQVVFRAAEKVGSTRVLLDDILLTDEDGGPQPSAASSRPRTGTVTIDCTVKGQPISPLVYGLGSTGARDSERARPWETGATARRWGGNASSRFNWENGHAWNSGNDHFFENVNLTGTGGDAFEEFLAENRAHGAETVLTVPILGWVAKDTTSYSFPVSSFGRQQATAPENADIGNGAKPDGMPIPPGPPTRTSVAAPPGFVGRWVASIREKDRKRGRSVRMYVLDNEPSLWNSTHRDVHPRPLTYDELLERTVAYASEIRKADPEAVIAGPADRGWSAMLFSTADLDGRPDRASHGNVALLPWWLREVNRAEKKLGVRLVDVLDTHWYPQFEGAGVGSRGATDPLAAARRIRSVRSLWDPTYMDESWIHDKVELIPRLRRWIAEYHPDGPMGIAIGEWNWGAEEHISGGLATAAALGVFGRTGVLAAFHATVPPHDSPSDWAFRAFRNYDGRGARFQDLSQPAQVVGTFLEAFASRSLDGDRVVVVLLNEDPASPAETTVDVSSCGTVQERRVFVYAGRPQGFEEVRSSTGVPLNQTLPPYAMTVVEFAISPLR
jgi:hypothetical protein